MNNIFDRPYIAGVRFEASLYKYSSKFNPVLKHHTLTGINRIKKNVIVNRYFRSIVPDDNEDIVRPFACDTGIYKSDMTYGYYVNNKYYSLSRSDW